ncbi:hypothetical protein DUI87_19668 [Hirundo rustica rustica]|uniref:ribonuclease H n=1 Tax=Hirundo rustica rustica TaxID=333673 RepID=A0A3M0JRP3_HIRRU|nr:hypothetical protein DUI87_19668 [Hirundo rustica rustica]
MGRSDDGDGEAKMEDGLYPLRKVPMANPEQRPIGDAAATEERPTQKLNWKTDSPVWVEQWPLSKEKLKALQELVDEQLAKGHIVETTSPWNSPVFVIKKANKGKWRLLHDLHQINNIIEDMGSLQPGMPSPAMLPQNWNLAIIDIKDCFFQIPLHPDDDPRFTFSVPTLNRKAPRKRYHWKFLPQGMKNSPSICQWYLSSLLSPVHAAVGEAIILHYMDDVLVCAPSDDLLSHVLDLTINSLVAAGFDLQEEKILRMPPWKYLGLETGKQTTVPQKLVVKNNIKTIADVQQLCGSLNWLISIEIQNPEIPIRIKQYPISLEGRKGLKPVVENSVHQGVLESCVSPHNTPILPVKKPDGSYRLVQDLRAVNQRTITRFPGVAKPDTS